MMKRQMREKKTYETLRRLPPKQILFIFIGAVIILAVLILSNAAQLYSVRESTGKLENELSELKALNGASEPIHWENRDSERILRDYSELDALYKRLFTFRTLDDMADAKEKASQLGLSKATLSLLYDPDEILSQDIMLEADSASFVDCYYADSDIFLIGIYDDFYRYLSRVSLDVLADYNVTLILFLDVDASGKIINDSCFIGDLPAESIF